MKTFKQLKAIVFDWAGTMIDHGSRAPAIVFKEIFRQQGIVISIEQAREPMGMAKREHIAAITRMPSVAMQWQEQHGTGCQDDDIENMYQRFLPLQKETLKNHCDLINGAAEVANRCRELGLKIGSTTGYTRELMEEVMPLADAQGYTPDLMLCAEDVPRGRPAPFLLFETAKLLDVYPMSHVVKVDDTVMGIQAGLNAGSWNVGITRTGNLLGLSEKEVTDLDANELKSKLDSAADKLTEAGAHATIESVSDLLPVLEKLDSQLDSGQHPSSVKRLVTA